MYCKFWKYCQLVFIMVVSLKNFFLFFAVLGLCCCVRAFSGCGVQASRCDGSCVEEHGLQRVRASEVAAHRYWSVGSVDWPMGLVALRHVESFWTRD